jgi:hypothetical protein
LLSQQTSYQAGGEAAKRNETERVSKPSRHAKKPVGYPNETTGSKLAAEMRKEANKMTSEQKSQYFRKAMALIYAADGAKDAASARH